MMKNKIFLLFFFMLAAIIFFSGCTHPDSDGLFIDTSRAEGAPFQPDWETRLGNSPRERPGRMFRTL